MTKTKLTNYLRICAELAEQKGGDGLAYVRPDALRAALELIPSVEPTESLAQTHQEVLIDGHTWNVSDCPKCNPEKSPGNRPCPLCGRTDNHTHKAGPFGMT